MRTSRTLSLLPQQHAPTSSGQTICQCPQSYAPSVVSELSHRLELEREAHAQTRCQAEENIALLECAIARRDAEIEKWIGSGSSRVPENSAFRTDSTTPFKRLTEISQEAMRRLDELTSERNKLLKMELQVLRDKVW